MAELGETRDPIALIPGQPAAIEDNVVAIRGRGRSMEQAGDNLKQIDSGAWEGEAADAFREKFSYEPSRWHRAGDAFEAAAMVLDDYGSTLRWAQGQAREAIALYERGEAATRQARAEHQANTAAGERVAPFDDPGEEKRKAAHDMLNRARQQLTEAGDRAASTIRARGDEAPEESLWDDIGDGLAAVGDFAADFGMGVWDTVSGTGELLWDLSPHHLLTDPEAYGETWEQLGDTAASAWNEPVTFLTEAGKAAISWEHWKNGDPGRAIGQMVSGAAIGYGVGKVASTAGKLRPDHDSDSDSDSEGREEQSELNGERVHEEFDQLESGRNANVRLVHNQGELRELFDRWTSGAEKLPPRGEKIPEVYELEDGTQIQWRTVSSQRSGGGATIDIADPDGETFKVHIDE